MFNPIAMLTFNPGNDDEDFITEPYDRVKAPTDWGYKYHILVKRSGEGWLEAQAQSQAWEEWEAPTDEVNLFDDEFHWNLEDVWYDNLLGATDRWLGSVGLYW